MSDTLARTIELIEKSLTSLSTEKTTGKVLYEIDMRQGGIGKATVQVKNNLTGEKEK